MAYQIIKPEIKSIRASTWRNAIRRWQFWAIFLISSGASLFLIVTIIVPVWADPTLSGVKGDEGFGKLIAGFLCIPIFAIGFYISSIYSDIRKSFWEEVARLNGWKYSKEKTTPLGNGAMFQRGHSAHAEHHLLGTINNDREFELFQYSFVTGSGKESRMHNFSIVTLVFKGNFPHIYLNRKGDQYGIGQGETLPLPKEFEKKFSLHVPKKYEIEALSIFTPDVLSKILDMRIISDVEFVDQKIIFCINGVIDSVDILERELSVALEIEDLLDEKLDTFKFHKIGDMSYHLK